MALVDAALINGIVAGLASQFPIPSDLLPAEKTKYTAAQLALATALASPIDVQIMTGTVTGVVTSGAGTGGDVTGAIT